MDFMAGSSPAECRLEYACESAIKGLFTVVSGKGLGSTSAHHLTDFIGHVGEFTDCLYHVFDTAMFYMASVGIESYQVRCVAFGRAQQE